VSCTNNESYRVIESVLITVSDNLIVSLTVSVIFTVSTSNSELVVESQPVNRKNIRNRIDESSVVVHWRTPCLVSLFRIAKQKRVSPSDLVFRQEQPNRVHTHRPTVKPEFTS
jgi:hypothetical protein